MSRTYKATGINLKSVPIGESDRLLTVLTREVGLVRAVAMGSRKHNSRLGGRSSLFVVNELLIAKGRSLDKITQAETLESYPKLAQDLRKLTASQYLAELCLCQALSDQPQAELFDLLNEHLKRIEQTDSATVLAHLTQAIFQLLILAGIAPQVHLCCMTRQPLGPNFADPNWRVGFSIPSGGTVTLPALEQLQSQQRPIRRPIAVGAEPPQHSVAESSATYSHQHSRQPRSTTLNLRITAPELALLQQLAQVDLPQVEALSGVDAPTDSPPLWLAIERILRQYAQYHFDRPIRSATLIDALFPVTSPPPQL